MFFQDLRYAFRGLARRPGFTAIAVITLSLGIGATTAIFSVVQAVLLRPLEYPQADRLLKIRGFDRKEGTIGNLSPADFLDFQRDATTIRAGGRERIRGPVHDQRRTGRARTRRRRERDIGILPDARRSARPRPRLQSRRRHARCRGVTIILSDGFWRRRFGADPAIVGKSITLNARPATVIGVLPASYRHHRDQSRAQRRHLHALRLQSGAGQSRRSLHPRRRALEGRRDGRAGARRIRRHCRAPRARFPGRAIPIRA